MKKLMFLLFILFLISCEKNESNIRQHEQFSEADLINFKSRIVRYIDKLPPRATHQNKFETQFDSIYLEKAKRLELVYYTKNDDTIYFAVYKIAPSLKVKKTATLGKLILDKNDSISFYEESYRTWKMEQPELNQKTEMLFRLFINNESLKQYYTENSNGNFYIEFPDEFTFYDKKNRVWVSKKRF